MTGILDTNDTPCSINSDELSPGRDADLESEDKKALSQLKCSYLECGGRMHTPFDHPELAGGSVQELQNFVNRIAYGIRTESVEQREDLTQELIRIIWQRSAEMQDQHMVCSCVEYKVIFGYWKGAALRLIKFGCLDTANSIAHYDSRRLSLDDDEEFEEVSMETQKEWVEFVSHAPAETRLRERLAPILDGTEKDPEVEGRLEHFLGYLHPAARQQYIASTRAYTNDQVSLSRGNKSDSARRATDRLEKGIARYVAEFCS